MTNQLHPILHKPIQSLQVSAEFKAMAKANALLTIEQILHESIHEFPFKKLSGYRLLKELLDILRNHGLSELIED